MNSFAAAATPMGWAGFVRCLRRDYDLETRHFAIHVLRRNPPDDRGAEQSIVAGVHGLRDRELLKFYAETLEVVYEQFRRRGWPQPRMHPEEGIPVYVFAGDDLDFDGHSPGSAFMDEIPFYRNDRYELTLPVICLPSRISVGLKSSELAIAESIAAHELAHVFIASWLSQTPPSDTALSLGQVHHWIKSWLWLNEATAVATEALLPLNSNWLDCALDWLDRPERSLDDPCMKYQAALFVRYLMRWVEKSGSDAEKFLIDVWKRSAQVWSVLPRERRSAIGALIEAARTLDVPFASCEETDLFASGYCFDSYFLDSPASLGFEQQVAERWSGGRAVTRTWRLSMLRPEVHDQRGHELQVLACRYYRFIPETTQPGATLQIRIRAPQGHQLKAEAALVPPGNSSVAGGRVTGRRIRGSQDILELDLPGFSATACQHVVLVVSNCGVAADQPFQPFQAWNQPATKFQVQASIADTR